MAIGNALRFTDSDQYQAAVRAGRAEVFITAAGKFSADLTRIDMDRLWLQHGADSLARVARVALNPERAPIFFLADLDEAPILHSRREMQPDQIAFYGAGAIEIQTTNASHRWSTMSLTPTDLAQQSEAMAGRPVSVPADSYLFRPDPIRFARLRALHAGAVRLAASEAPVLAHPATAKALEQELMREMIACLIPPTVESRRFWQHAYVMSRFDAFLASKRYEPVYVAEICAATGVSERTLRTCCQETFGMGPVRYLWLRRMHYAHRALLRADPAHDSVTGIATAHGFWELGRFSVEYASLFGHPPSRSLRQPAAGAHDAR